MIVNFLTITGQVIKIINIYILKNLFYNFVIFIKMLELFTYKKVKIYYNL
jgi:hypothetical protein